jgi:hypothetical protein
MLIALCVPPYLDRVSSKLPENLVGLLGDYVEQKRLRRLADLWAETREHLRKRGVIERVDVSPSVLLPLLGAAMDEDRAVLKELWAKLLAAAMDPNRADFVRPSLISLLKQMDPLDARILAMLADGIPANQNAGDLLAENLKVSRDDAHLPLTILVDDLANRRPRLGFGTIAPRAVLASHEMTPAAIISTRTSSAPQCTDFPEPSTRRQSVSCDL